MSNPRTVTEAAGASLLDALKIPRPRAILARSRNAAIAAGRELGGPLVVKIQSPQILHKSDIGGVQVGVSPGRVAHAYDEVHAAARRVPGAQLDGVLIQELAPPGTELILGVQGSRHGYPPIVTIGLGGVSTEVYADVASSLAPIHSDDAHALLRQLRGWPLLAGFRGRPTPAIDAVVDTITTVSHAAVQLGDQLDELEINPLLVNEAGVTALDLLIRPQRRCHEA